MLLVIQTSGQYNPQDAQFAGEWPQIGNHHLVQSVKKLCFTYVFIQFYTFIQYLYIYTIFIHLYNIYTYMFTSLINVFTHKKYTFYKNLPILHFNVYQGNF